MRNLNLASSDESKDTELSVPFMYMACSLKSTSYNTITSALLFLFLAYSNKSLWLNDRANLEYRSPKAMKQMRRYQIFSVHMDINMVLNLNGFMKTIIGRKNIH